MAWPPANNAANTYTLRTSGTPATLAWGTDGIYSGVILKSIRSTEMVEEVKIENGTGLTACLVGLRDGDEVELTCEDDRHITTWPRFMGTVVLLDPGIGSVDGTLSSTTTFQVISNNWSGARKQNGERVILAKKYTLITPA